MAPMILEHNLSSDSIVANNSFCSDPLVVPSNKASSHINKLWWLHGHPHSKRYSDPKLISLAALVRYDGQIYKGEKAFLYPISTEPSSPYGSMSWDEFDSVTEAIAITYAYQLRKELQNGNKTQTQPTVALLGTGTTLEYFCTELALQKLGLRVLLLAESNASNAIHFLLDTCNAVAVITDSKNAKADTNGIRKLHMIERLPLDSHVDSCEVDAVKFQDFGDVWERHTFIIHSSGSTGMPKPIIHTNRSMMLIARMYRLFQDFSIENWFLLFPLYHIAGVSIALSGLPHGQILSFPPLCWPPSASKIFTAWETLASIGHPVECVHCAPTLIETMYDFISDNGYDFNPLSSLKVLQPGGAVLSDTIIKDLTAHGVNVKTTYGSTEIGPPFRSIPHTRSNPKCYSFRNLYPDDPFLKMEQVGEGLYECIIYKGFGLAADLWQGKPDNEPYRTNDLFIQDPPGSGFYVMQGRKDDILVHTNGENTSAGSLQLDIQNSSKLINKALALGHSLPCVSLLVELNTDYDPKNSLIKQELWKTVEKVNSNYPPHSRIMPTMIYILPIGSKLPVTPKGNVKRKEAEILYSKEISQLYTDDVTPPTLVSTTQEPLADYLRALFANLSKTDPSTITDTTTIYDLGIDSRAALILRRTLTTHLQKPVSLSHIYEHPTIAQLLPTLLSSVPNPDHPTTAERVNTILARLESSFHARPRLEPLIPRAAPEQGETVLLTGATGSLGTALLEVLTSHPRVKTIYALVRGPRPEARLREALTSHGLPAEMLEAGVKVVVLQYNMRDQLLGVGEEMYERLRREVTLVVHGAWKVDFNMAVEAFEDDCLQGTVSLLSFCASTTPPIHFAFTSSISTNLGSPPPSSNSHELFPSRTPIPESPPLLHHTYQQTGYAQSKYIVERLLSSLSQTPSTSTTNINTTTPSPFPTTILRIGQLCGHTRTSHWNTQEWFPILIASVGAVGALPVLEMDVDWVPVDVAARCVVEVLVGGGGGEVGMGMELEKNQGGGGKSEEGVGDNENDAGNIEDVCEKGDTPKQVDGNEQIQVYNIVNPNPIPWTTLLAHLQNSSLAPHVLEEICMEEWVRRLDILSSSCSSASDEDEDEEGGSLSSGFRPSSSAATASTSASIENERGSDNSKSKPKSKTNTIPAHRLQSFFTSLANHPNSGHRFETKMACERSEALRLCGPVGEGEVGGWVRGWGLDC